jgi:cysteine desulfurase
MIDWWSGRHGDPARLHAEGGDARFALETAREAVAAMFGASPREVVFTSGASESINAATWGATGERQHIVHAAVEHAAVRASSSRHDVTVVGVDNTGAVDPDEVNGAIRDDTALVHLQLANHEVGVIQPVEEVAGICSERNVLLHVDAAMGAGQLAVEFDSAGIDLMSVSSHKLGGPTGVGALLTRSGVRLRQFIVGGDQERARRAGLENVGGVLGFATACAELTETRPDEAAHQRELSNTLRSAGERWDGFRELSTPGSLPNIVCWTIEDIEPQAVILGLDRRGIAAHSGSACASEGLEPSPVLEAMGADAHRSLRISVGWNSTTDDVAAAIIAIPEVVAELRDLAGSR